MGTSQRLTRAKVVRAKDAIVAVLEAEDEDELEGSEVLALSDALDVLNIIASDRGWDV